MPGVFRFDFYGKEWIVDTRELSPEARGIYIDTLTAIYLNGGPIPYDLEHLRSLFALKSVRKVKRILDELTKTKKIHIIDNMIVNYRAEEELGAIALRVERGKSANSRRLQNQKLTSLEQVSSKLGANLEQTQSKLEAGIEQNQGDDAHLFTVNRHRHIELNLKNDGIGNVDNLTEPINKPRGTPIKLQDLEKLRKQFPGYSIEFIETSWIGWNASKGIDVNNLDNPLGALIGFIKIHVKNNPIY